MPAVVQAAIGESESHPGAVFIVAMAIIYILQLVIGIPGYFLLHRFGRHALPPYALFGLCVGLCAGAALVVFAWLHSRLDIGLVRQLLGIAYWGILGMVTTASFWFGARPDRAVRPAMPKPN